MMSDVQYMKKRFSKGDNDRIVISYPCQMSPNGPISWVVCVFASDGRKIRGGTFSSWDDMEIFIAAAHQMGIVVLL